MPFTPHQITVTVKDDAGTNLQNAKVYVRNTTKKTQSAEINTNSSGQALIDLANLPIQDGQSNAYDSGDVILIIAYKGNQSDAARYVVTGSSKTQALQMNDVVHQPGLNCRLGSILGANTSGTVAYARVYSVNDGELLAHIEVPANDSRGHVFGERGKGANGGFVIEREATTLVVTTSLR